MHQVCQVEKISSKVSMAHGDHFKLYGMLEIVGVAHQHCPTTLNRVNYDGLKL